MYVQGAPSGEIDRQNGQPQSPILIQISSKIVLDSVIEGNVTSLWSILDRNGVEVGNATETLLASKGDETLEMNSVLDLDSAFLWEPGFFSFLFFVV